MRPPRTLLRLLYAATRHPLLMRRVHAANPGLLMRAASC